MNAAWHRIASWHHSELATSCDTTRNVVKESEIYLFVLYPKFFFQLGLVSTNCIWL